MSVDLDYERQAALARDHIDGLHGIDPSMRRPGCAQCIRYVTIHGTHRFEGEPMCDVCVADASARPDAGSNRAMNYRPKNGDEVQVVLRGYVSGTAAKGFIVGDAGEHGCWVAPGDSHVVSVAFIQPAELKWQRGDVVRNSDDDADERAWVATTVTGESTELPVPESEWQLINDYDDRGRSWFSRDELPKHLTLLVRNGKPAALLP